MPKPFHELSLDEFVDLVGQFPFTRRIESVHMHHTWRPNHADFASRPPLTTIDGMYNFHTQVNHWSDIAQHVTIDPQGKIWTGRDWNRQPASSTGFNGTALAGPFMFEMIGDFDEGRDPFEGAQKEAAIGVIVSLLQRFKLPLEAVRFHNQMTDKTCPGAAIKRESFLDEVQTALDAAAGTARAFSAFGETENARRLRSLAIVANWGAASKAVLPDSNAGEGEPAEDAMNANNVAVITGAASPAAISSRGLFGPSADFTAEEKQILRPHVIDLKLGLFSTGGKYQTSLADVQRIFQELLPAELEQRQKEGQPLRLVFYSHGGLNSQEEGLRPVLRRLPFWRQNGMYPIFFCWETGLKETVVDLVKSVFTGQRGLVADTTNAVLEAVAGTAGQEVWGQMKRSAELASMQGGGARIVAEMTRDFWAANNKNMEIHAVGHSAGSIFHSYFLPTLLDQKLPKGVAPISVKSLHFLTPACTTALFESKLMPRIGPKKQILSHTMYTMNKDLEQADKAGPYQASLLYFVSRAFEDQKPTPILGLEESLRDDPALIRFYGLTRTIPGVGKILFSKTAPDAPLDSATESTTHGDFDNEVKTMNSVARRILNRPTGSIVSFVDEAGQNEVTQALAFAPAAAAAQSTPALAPAISRATSPGALKALCIGIDSYPSPNDLAGCVNDARAWATLFQSLKFEVTTLLNQQATRGAILDGIGQLIASARSGDVVVIQYAGHGTQVQDLNGDETDGLDEALVPVDFGTGSFLIDDDLRRVMSNISDGVNVTCFMDCCHSGTNTRFLGPTPVTAVGESRVRFLKMTPDLTSAHIAFRSQQREGPAPPPRSAADMREVNFGACTPAQVAFETNGSGDFTSRAIPILRNGLAGLTNAAFLARVIDAFGSGARQQPVIDCAPGVDSRALLGASAASAGMLSQPAAGATDAILRRLDNLERRLASLGAGTAADPQETRALSAASSQGVRVKSAGA